MSRMFQLMLGCFLLSFATETSLRAYVDPGSGTLVWQTLLAAFVGAMFYFRRFITWFKSKGKDGRE